MRKHWKQKIAMVLVATMACSIITEKIERPEKHTVYAEQTELFDNENEDDAGTAKNPFQISTAEQLIRMREVIDDGGESAKGVTYSRAYYELTKDIVVNDITVSETGEISGGDSSGKYMIWENRPNDMSFQGHFDGGGNTISGLVMRNYEKNPDGIPKGIGLFSSVKGNSETGELAEIKGVVIANSVIQLDATSGDDSMYKCGFLAGNIEYANVSECTIGDNCAIQLNSSIFNNVNQVGSEYASLDQLKYETYANGVIGGIVGSAYQTTISNCVNTGSIMTSNCSVVGGILGYGSETTVTNCSNAGKITGVSAVGGIVGYMNGKVVDSVGGQAQCSSRVISCENKGSVKGNCWTNELIASEKWDSSTLGQEDYNEFGNCIGGIAGISAATIANCVNEAGGTVEGYRKVGGIVGEGYNDITGSTNLAAVKADLYKYEAGQNSFSVESTGNYVGGIAGGIDVNSKLRESQLALLLNDANHGKVSVTKPDTDKKIFCGGIYGDKKYVAQDGDSGNEPATVENCISTTMITMKEGEKGSYPFSSSEHLNAKHCFYQSEKADANGAVTASQMASGEVGYKLQNYNAASKVWGQKLTGTKDVAPRTYTSKTNAQSIIKINIQDKNKKEDFSKLSYYTNYGEKLQVNTLFPATVWKSVKVYNAQGTEWKTTSAMTGDMDFYIDAVKATKNASTPVALPKTVVKKEVIYEATKTGEYTVKKLVNKEKKKIVIPDFITVNGKSYRVTSIAKEAYINCKKLEEVKMGKYILTIGKAAFKNCSKLKKVTFSAKLKVIADNAFLGCKKLTKVQLPNSVYKVGKAAFKNCKSLKTFILGKRKKSKKSKKKASAKKRKYKVLYGGISVKISIAASALENCTALKKVIINTQVRKIGNNAFKRCIKLTDIIVYSLQLKTVGNKALSGVSNCKIGVPVKKVKPYKTLFKNKGQGKKVVVAKL